MNNKIKEIVDRIPIKIVADVMPDPSFTIREMNECGYIAGDVLPCNSDIAYRLNSRGYEVFNIQYHDKRCIDFDAHDYDIDYPMCGVSLEDWHGILRKYSFRDIKRMLWCYPNGAIREDYDEMPVDAMISILPDKSTEVCYAPFPYGYSHDLDDAVLYKINEETGRKLFIEGKIPVYWRLYPYENIRPIGKGRTEADYPKNSKEKNEAPNAEYFVKKEDWENYLFHNSLEHIYNLLWAPSSTAPTDESHETAMAENHADNHIDYGPDEVISPVDTLPFDPNF